MTIKKNVVCSSSILGTEMHVNVYGKKGLPIVVFPTLGQAPESIEEAGVIDELADYLDSGTVQLFCTETIDSESWGSAADPEQRAQRQETYYHYVVDELVPLVHKVSGGDARPLALGCDAGATQAAIVALRRPDLFQGCVCLSGCYDSRRYFGDWMHATLYDNTPCAFLAQMPADHPYVAVYNQRQLLFCTGQEASEADSLRATRAMDTQLARLGVEAWCDYWGGDVTHTWFWWKKQLRYFLPIVLADVEKTTAAEKPAKKRATTRKKAATTKAASAKAAAAKPAAAATKAAAAKPAAAATKAAAAKPATKKAATTKDAAEKTAAKAEEKPATKAAATKTAAKPAAKKPAAAKPAAKPAAAKATADKAATKTTAVAKAEKPAAPAKAEKAAVPAKAVKAAAPAKATKAAAPAKAEDAPKAAPAAKKAAAKPATKAATAKTAAKPAAAKAETKATTAKPAAKPAVAPKASAKKPAKGTATK